MFDGLSAAAIIGLRLVIFVAGYQYFKTEEDNRILLFGLVIAGLIYTIPTLFEVRMAPVLHSHVFGYFQHSFFQHIRGFGFRPVVFLPHGLWLAFFIAVTLCAAVAYSRIYAKEQPESGGLHALFAQYRIGVIIYITAVLVLCNSLASLIYGLFFLAAGLLFRPSTQVKIASVLCLIAITYPATRALDIFPHEQIVALASKIDVERASSVKLRFDHEGAILEKALERPLFGWGGWGRYRVVDEYTGQDRSISDGYWVIIFGSHGAMQYLAFYLLMSSGIIVLAFFRKREVGFATGALCLILSVNMIELLPNSTIPEFTWLIAGSIAGLAFSKANAEAPKRREKADAGAIAASPATPGRRTIL